MCEVNKKKLQEDTIMNKAELIAAIADKAELSRKDSEAAVNALVDAVTAALKKDDKVQLVGFGSFEVKKRAARTGRNPKTKETIQIPASKVPVFKAGKALKDAVAK
jgi:DNA-binding protein HU-beta